MMSNDNEIIKYEYIIKYYNKYVLPTFESKYIDKDYIDRYIIKLCNINNIEFHVDDEKINMKKNDFQIIKKMFENRYLFRNEEIELYNANYIEETFNLPKYKINEIMSKKENIACLIKGEKYVYKKVIEELVYIDKYFLSIEEITKILNKKLNINYVCDEEILKNVIRFYIDYNMKKVDYKKKTNQVIYKYDKNDIEKVIEIINGDIKNGYFEKNIQIEKLNFEYKKYVVPTLKNNKYIKERANDYIVGICKTLAINYEQINNGILLNKDDYLYIKQIMENRYLFINKKIKLFSANEICEILNIGKVVSDRFISKRENFACSINNKKYTYENIVMKIRSILDNYIELKDVKEIIKNEIDSDLTNIILENLIKKYCKRIEHPIRKSCYLYNKEDISTVILNINTYKSKNTERIDEIKSRAIKLYNDDNINEYYSFNEINKFFTTLDIHNIETRINVFFYKNRKYYSKENINNIIENTRKYISIEDCKAELNIKRHKMDNLLESLNIKFYRGYDIPGISYILYKSKNNKNLNLKFITNDDKEKIKKYLDNKEKIKKLEDRYEKFNLKVSDIKYNNNIKTSIDILKKYSKERFKSKGHFINDIIGLYTFLSNNLYKDITKYNDKEIEELIKLVEKDGIERELNYFIKYLKDSYLVKYKGEYTYKKNKKGKYQPYSKEQWKCLGNLLFNISNKSFLKQLNLAIKNRKYAVIWLYCALYFVSTWRYSDINMQMPLPKLELIGLNEYEFIQYVEDGKFDLKMSQVLVNNMIKEIDAFQITPNKTTKNRKGKALLKMVIHEDYVFVIGMMLGLCESHRRMELNDCSDLIPNKFITRKKYYEDFFGYEYKRCFKDENFISTRAIKTFLQFGMAIIDKGSKANLISAYTGYNIMSILKSHSRTAKNKEISNITEVYLTSELDEFDFDKVLLMIEKRGVFGFLYHQLCKVVYGDLYVNNAIENQNDFINGLQLSNPLQAEKLSELVSKNHIRINKIIDEFITGIDSEGNEAYENLNRKERMNVLMKKLANGECPSKMEYSQCLLKAIDIKLCKYPRRKNDCIGCDYLIAEIFFLIEFNYRLNEILQDISDCEYEFDRERYVYTLLNVYIPILKDAIDKFGIKRVDAFINRKELNNKLKELKIVK